MRARALAVSVAALAIGGIGPAGAADPPSPTSLAPIASAWFDVARATTAVPPAPMAGVSASDLVVEGVTITTAQLPVAVPVPPLRYVSAFTALSFALPAGATPSTLRLGLSGFTTAKLDARLPSGVSPFACKVTSTFAPGGDQPLASAPTYDCARSVIGHLSSDGTTVEFTDIDRLTSGRTLAFVVLPGTLGVERLVFAAPSASTLSLSYFGGTGSAPIVPVPLRAAPSAPTPTPAATAPAASVTSGAALAPPVEPPVTMPSPAPVAAPQIAAPSAVAPLGVTQPRPLALTTPDTGRERTVAVALLVLLLVATGWLVRTETVGVKVARRKVGDPALGGVGRFRSVRSGLPPPL